MKMKMISIWLDIGDNLKFSDISNIACPTEINRIGLEINRLAYWYYSNRGKTNASFY